MIWWLAVVGVFLLLGAAMYLPDWIRFARWNSRRKRLPPNKARKLRPPVATPFWSSYVGSNTFDTPSGDAAACGPGWDGGGGAVDVAGDVGGGGDTCS